MVKSNLDPLFEIIFNRNIRLTGSIFKKLKNLYAQQFSYTLRNAY